MNKVGIIGGGASGMMAAIESLKAGCSVTIFEHKDKPGKKILATGNGKCNFANLHMSDQCYHSDNADFYKYAMNEFGPGKIIDYFKDLGIYPKNKNGYIYPSSEQAASVCEVLIRKVMALGAIIVYENVSAVTKTEKGGFNVSTGDKKYFFDKIIICTGGKASPNHGSDGSGYEIAKKLGHHIITPVPALVQLKCSEKFYKTISGVRLDARVSLNCGDKNVSDSGEIIFTDQGISGIPVFQISRFASKMIAEGKKVNIKIDLFPELSSDLLYDEIERRLKQFTDGSIEKTMVGLLNHKLNYVVLKELGYDAEASAKGLNRKDAVKIADKIKNFCCNVKETNGFDSAQVTAGGIDTREVSDKTMESKIVPGVFFAGEVLDVDGMCGGYNLMWAWSSGHLAGNSLKPQERK